VSGNAVTVDVDRLSKSQVNKAGKTLRKWRDADPTQVRAAFDVLLAFRAAHQYPLTKATMGLRSMVRTEACQVEVSQRLKRVPTMIDKLVREPTMPLASMQDIGGCRAVLRDVAEVRRVQRRLAKNRPPVRLNDYIANPRPSGYRGVHLIVVYDGRHIEVQLRTEVMPTGQSPSSASVAGSTLT
jgi:(p)ppGpp synthase/HD superfamily hydrolase